MLAHVLLTYDVKLEMNVCGQMIIGGGRRPFQIRLRRCYSKDTQFDG
jgi:hypothetical protein